MSLIEVAKPIINSPYEEPQQHWYLQEGEQAELRQHRRPGLAYPPREAKVPWEQVPGILKPSKEYSPGFELELVNTIRERVKQWRKEEYPGVTRTTLELLKYWRRDGRRWRLFYAQLEAAETIIFLHEARQDLLQGIVVPSDEPSDTQKKEGAKAFRRYCSKLATGGGKTTVMAMVAAWSILNKVVSKQDRRYSDVVLVVAPNVTIRSRLGELDPEQGEASLYRTRDLVPPHLMDELRKGRVLITNWHMFERRGLQTGGVGSKVDKRGVPTRVKEKITIGKKTESARGKRYLRREDLDLQVAQGLLTILEKKNDEKGELKAVWVEGVKYLESDAAWIERVLGREVGGKQNIMIMNDEAHHAYRIRRDEPDEDDALEDEDESDAEEFIKEATIWVEGLDRIHKLRGINMAIDLSATPYFLGRMGQDSNKPFPWIVSDFGLVEAIEAGLVKIPQMVTRDTTGNAIPGYFNIWLWILEKLTSAEKGGGRSPKPEAVLKWADHPITMLGADWTETLTAWGSGGFDNRPPVFILVVKNTKIAKVVYQWLAEGLPVGEVPPSKLEELRNRNGKVVTIRVDSKVVQETDSDTAKNDETAWMRLTLDTVGKTEWPKDRQGSPIYPDGFEALAEKLGKPLHPPGRDVRCIVSVGMLTEGWDCNTVTHIVGLRPFMSQLLCEQVVGRGLRRASYDIDENTGLMTEEVARVFGVPFEIIPYKSDGGKNPPPKPKRFHVHPIPDRADLEIKFPRVEGYQQAVKNRITVNWDDQPVVVIDPHNIPPEVMMKAALPSNKGRPSLTGPGKEQALNLNPFRLGRRRQELVFEMAKTLTMEWIDQRGCELPPHVLFPQMTGVAERFIREKVRVEKPAEIIDLFLSPYWGWAIEKLRDAIRPDASAGDAPEIPRYEANRGPGSTWEVDYWTSKDVREVTRSHLNYVVADTKRWEQTAAYIIDTYPQVEAFTKNAGLGFAIPYFHNGDNHDYVPDFLVRFRGLPSFTLILETKGFDPLESVKSDAARRWVDAVNAHGKYGVWAFGIARKLSEVSEVLDRYGHIANAIGKYQDGEISQDRAAELAGVTRTEFLAMLNDYRIPEVQLSPP